MLIFFLITAKMSEAKTYISDPEKICRYLHNEGNDVSELHFMQVKDTIGSRLSILEAAQIAEKLREKCVTEGKNFAFETVLSTDRNLNLLKRAKRKGYFIRCIYVLTSDADINVLRVKTREQSGGHGVPKDKVISRYEKALLLIPDMISICDICHIYDNSVTPFRIFKKRKTEFFIWANEYWTEKMIMELTKSK